MLSPTLQYQTLPFLRGHQKDELRPSLLDLVKKLFTFKSSRSTQSLNVLGNIKGSSSSIRTYHHPPIFPLHSRNQPTSQPHFHIPIMLARIYVAYVAVAALALVSMTSAAPAILDFLPVPKELFPMCCLHNIAACCIN
ncbi:hypothetical protein BGZ46_002867 [Entomortierella lignicola]|nr:hypothetical protein BGZ46_002867 [Entomortierella lignicola]